VSKSSLKKSLARNTATVRRDSRELSYSPRTDSTPYVEPSDEQLINFIHTFTYGYARFDRIVAESALGIPAIRECWLRKYREFQHAIDLVKPS
jgi:hypothetical protein